MNRYIKTAVCFLLAIFLSGSITACGAVEENMQIIEVTDSQTEFLRFFSSTDFSGNDVGKYWSEQFINEYNKQVYIDYDAATYYADEGLSYRELLEKRLASSMPEDIYIINAEDVIEFERKGYWMDLSKMDFVNNLSDAALYQSTYEGKVFSVPLCFTGFGFYWNTNLLKEHGLSIPTNIDEFLTVCERLKAGGILPYGANKGSALTVPAMGKGMASLYRSADCNRKIEQLNSGELAVSTYMREGFEFLALLIEREYMDPEQALKMQPGEELEMFLNEECAFICSTLDQDVMECSDFPVALTGLPLLADGQIAVYGTDLRLAVNPNSKQIDTVCKFIEMVGTSKALDISAEIRGAMSSAKNSDLKIDSKNEELCELLTQPGQVPNQDFSLHFNTWENIRNIGREICGGISVEEACNKLDELQEMELEEYKKEKQEN